ncbi:hypothetical protein [Streptomyces bobili]|uniref:hypothetical protein n=1 Tax=Streptomyces bobili TaxID=67280 RepID=UPI003719692E
MVEWESGTLAVERLQGRLQRHGAGAVLKLEISKLAVEVPFTPDDLAAFAAPASTTYWPILTSAGLASWRILDPAGPTERTRQLPGTDHSNHPRPKGQGRSTTVSTPSTCTPWFYGSPKAGSASRPPCRLQHTTTPGRHLNLLAYALMAAERRGEARPVFEAINGTVAAWPWSVGGDPVSEFEKARNRSRTGV